MRTLIISHGHPDFSIGGAEVASYTLYKAINEMQGQTAYYLARAPRSIHKRSACPLMSLDYSERECFVQVEDWDEFWLSNGSITKIKKSLDDYLKYINPNIVHFHHVIGLGVEFIALVKQALPACKIVITFHEYLAICNNHGQMVKRGKTELCFSATSHNCQVCFPSRTVSEFFDRKAWIANHITLADAFISPSQFLIERYVSWGLKREKFILIENGVMGKAVGAARLPRGGIRNRFGYFGQISEFKGLHILLEAISRIPEELWGDASLSVFGGNLQLQPCEFQRQFESMLEAVGKRAKFCGSYRQDELSGLMQEVDWIVVPSIWWENSPVVIQEASLHQRPLIVSGIGGMAEKVIDGVTGLHFRVGSAESLADRLIKVLTEHDLWETLSSSAATPLSTDEFARRHIDAYSQTFRTMGSTNADMTLVSAN